MLDHFSMMYITECFISLYLIVLTFQKYVCNVAEFAQYQPQQKLSDISCIN